MSVYVYNSGDSTQGVQVQNFYKLICYLIVGIQLDKKFFLKMTEYLVGMVY